MTRSVLISSAGDPLLTSFCIETLKKNCWDEFDSLYICYNNYAECPKKFQGEFFSKYVDEPKIVDGKMISPKIKMIYYPYSLNYGVPITKMLQICDEDLILLLEDDGFIFTPGKIDECFKRIESGEVDALGSPRFSCGFELVEAIKQNYNLNFEGYGDKGPNYWPNFFFCKREDLLKTDLNFNPKDFIKGTFYPELNHTMSETESGDTFVWAGLQMRFNGVRFGEIPQFHCSPTEIQDKENGDMNWRNGTPFWLHGGSLSVNKFLKGFDPHIGFPEFANESAKMEFETRVAWWTICADTIEGFDEYKVQYRIGLEDLINGANLDRKRINLKIDLYKTLLKI